MLPEFSGDQLREKFWLGLVICLGDAFGSAPARRAEIHVQILAQMSIFILQLKLYLLILNGLISFVLIV